jgi:hypothetical protein
MGLMSTSRVLVLLGAAGLALVASPRESRAQSCEVPGFDFAAFGDTGVAMQNGNTDSYNSNNGSYASTNCTSSPPCTGGVATNNATSGGVSLGPNGSVKGGCQIGAGGTTADITPNSSNCDSTSVQGSNVALPIPTLPSTLNGSYGAISNNLTIPGAGAYSMTSLNLSGNKSLEINSGPVVIYLTGSGNVLSLSGNAAVNNNTAKPSNLVFMCTSTTTPQSISVVGNGNAFYAIYCPLADITITGNGTIYGAVVGKKVSYSGNNGFIHYDQALATFTSDAISCGIETSRASPIVTDVTPGYGGGPQTTVVQGSFEKTSGTAPTITTTASVATWTFPFVPGHMRARLASTITTTASSFSGTTCTAANTPAGCSVVFDAGATGKIPAASATCASPTGSCRYVFTNTNAAATNGTTFRPTVQQLLKDDTNSGRVADIGGLIAPTSVVSGIGNTEWKAIINKVLAGKLGGVDRSTIAIENPSTVAGSATRPVIGYFGARDGMLHAVCMSTPSSGACSGVPLGTELWAFVPRVQLPLIRNNTARIDGSVRVVDAFGDFTNSSGTGQRSWKTVVVFQTGYGLNATPAVYALDVTDPGAPTLLWETTAPASPGSAELGTGLNVVAGPTTIGGRLTNLAVVQTNNGGSGGPGVVTTALSLETGEKIWQFSYIYPTIPRGDTAETPVPATGIPGGAVGIDLDGIGEYSDFVFGDLYGNFWRVDAATGVSRNGATTPRFSFSGNRHPIGVPPAIYENGGQQYAVFATGGYTDHANVGLWNTPEQFVIAIKLNSASGTSVDETANACSTCDLAFKATTTGQYAFSQALVVGTQVFLTTDSTDVNSINYGTQANTGSVRSINLADGTSTTAVINAGASSLANSATTLYSSAGQKQQQMSTAATGTVGARVDLNAFSSITRLLWLRAE